MATKKSQGRKPWTLDDKIRLLAESAKLAGAQRSAFLEREGLLLLAELEQWRQALGDETGEDEDDMGEGNETWYSLRSPKHTLRAGADEQP